VLWWRRKQAGQSTDTEQPTILVVDDEPPIARLIAVNLQRAGYEVIVAHDGEAALGEARARHPDGIVLDANMPELSGWEVLSHLQAHPETRTIPVLMLGGEREGEWPPGLAGYLQKPFSSRELQRFLERVLDAASRKGR